MTRSALGRSFDVYYRDAARTERMDALNARFVQPGGLAFDIGAHVGDRTASFRRLGASVICVEPQPNVFRALRLIHGADPEVTLRCEAVGAQRGTMEMFVNTKNPTVSTVSEELVSAAVGSDAWRDQVWDARQTVHMTTLDHLIAEHGVPDFIKIDVEGHEASVLEGVSQPVRALSFEFTTLQRPVALACLDRLDVLGRWVANVSLGEDHAFQWREWGTLEEVADFLRTLPEAANSGDVYVQSTLPDVTKTHPVGFT